MAARASIEGVLVVVAGLVAWSLRARLIGHPAALPVDRLGAAWWVLGAMAAMSLATRSVRVVSTWHRQRTLHRHGLVLCSLVLLGTALVFSFWLANQWPGAFMTDSIASLYESRTPVTRDFYSIIYSVYFRALSRSGQAPQWIGVFQVVVATWAVTAMVAWALRQGVSRALVLGSWALFMLLPVAAYHNVFYTRDWLFGWLHLALTVAPLALGLRFRRPDLPVYWLVLLGVATAITARLRSDGVVLLVVVPAVLAIARVCRARSALALGLVAVLSFLFVNRVIAPYVQMVPSGPGYQITAVLNPLGAILRDPHYSDSPEGDDRAISPVVNLRVLKERHIPYELPAYWSWEVHRDLTGAQFRAVQARSLRLFIDNPDLFLGSRTTTFLASLGFSRWNFRFIDFLGDARDGRSESALRDAHVVKRPYHRPSYRLLQNYLRWSDTYEGLLSAPTFVWNSFPGLAFAIWLLFRRRQAPLCWAAAGIQLARTAIVFAGEPAAQFKYLYSLYLFGFVALPMYLAERRSRVS